MHEELVNRLFKLALEKCGQVDWDVKQQNKHLPANEKPGYVMT